MMSSSTKKEIKLHHSLIIVTSLGNREQEKTTNREKNEECTAFFLKEKYATKNVAKWNENKIEEWPRLVSEKWINDAMRCVDDK